MAASKNHGQLVTHAHIMLVEFAVSFVYAVIYKIWITESSSKLSTAQYICHQVGSIVLVFALYCMYGGLLIGAILEPILAISLILALIAMILMKVMFVKKGKSV